MTLYLILFFTVFFFSVGLIYGAIGRLTERWLVKRGWQIRDIEEERIGWEPELRVSASRRMRHTSLRRLVVSIQSTNAFHSNLDAVLEV